MANSIVHFEIPFADGDRARSFYRDAFDWEVAEMPDLDYTMVVTGPVGDDQMPSSPGYINGGMFQRTEPFTGPSLTIAVDSIDETIAKLESLGATAVGKKEAVGDMGYAAYFKDPEGNVMGLWENATPTG
ncbi:VOC family protein [Mumia zhuanghuii]|uniref:VOC family protein n=2 Tax=Mumia TaxID=1546255 RepID=A0ABW1QMM6_9ACTN|nr:MULTISPECIES: VOC family protein [Mumia]KAA1425240.1 VOC family protein [Mumia zhuanghuii]